MLRLDGSERFDVSAEGAPADAERLGREAGRDLASRLPTECWRRAGERAGGRAGALPPGVRLCDDRLGAEAPAISLNRLSFGPQLNAS